MKKTVLVATDSNTVAKTYTWGLDLSGDLQGAGGVGGLLSVTEHSDTGDSAYYPSYDANGNISEYVNDSDSVVAHYEYSPFGKLTSSSGSKSGDFRQLFSTKYLDDETALYYYGYRYYSSELGRWINRDPVAESGGLNLYIMLNNSPIYLTDYLGNGPIDWVLTGKWSPSKEASRAARKGFAQGIAKSPITKAAYTGNPNISDEAMSAATDSIANSMLGEESTMSGAVIGDRNAGLLSGKITSKMQIMDPETGSISIDAGTRISGALVSGGDDNVRGSVAGGKVGFSAQWQPGNRFGISGGGEAYGTAVDMETDCMCINGKYVKLRGKFRLMSASAGGRYQEDIRLGTTKAGIEALAKTVEWSGGADIQRGNGRALRTDGSLYGPGIGAGLEVSTGSIPPVSKFKLLPGKAGGGYEVELIRMETMDCN